MEGTAGTDLIRLSPVAYSNLINTPSLSQDSSVRLISDILNNQADPSNPSADIQTVDQVNLSDFGYAFGQFMDHDMDLTPNTNVSQPIQVPVGDPIGGANDTPLAFTLSQSDPNTGTSTSNPLQQVNEDTSFLDLSQVYGSDLATANALRTFQGGQMKTSPGGLLPLDNTDYFTTAQLAQINASVGGMANNGPLPETSLYVTGDTRGNENIELTALQTLFLDNHNKIASELQQEHPGWSDEQLYQEARKINIAEYQAIIYNEWIPAVMGANALPNYTGYNPNVDPAIATEFSTVGFRFGHSLLSGEIEREGNNGQPVASPIPLSVDFFDSNLLTNTGAVDQLTGLTSTGIAPILKADASGNSQAMDTQVINEVRNLLFNEVMPGVGGGQDLISLDLERARVDGIGSYNQLRVAYGLAPVTSFAQITSDPTIQAELEQAYQNNVNNIDPLEGIMAEDHLPGSDLGPLGQAILVDQFTRLRDGDRFYYLNEQWTPDEVNIFKQGNTLAKVIEGNTSITNLQSDVFIFTASISGTVTAKGPGAGGQARGIAGLIVELTDTSGDVLATTVTNRQGTYSFNQQSGPAADPSNAPGVSATGSYKIVLLLPHGNSVTSRTVTITVGGQNVGGIDFNVSQFGGNGWWTWDNGSGDWSADGGNGSNGYNGPGWGHQPGNH
jgi:hypothetical protein